MTKYKPYSIITPEYQITSGGVRVMYALQSWLETRGQIAFVNQYPTDTRDFVAIYPEIARGNLAGADHVVRYILNVPGVMGTAEALITQPTDKIYQFSELYNVDPFKVDKDHVMFLPVLNTHLFRVTNKGKRKFKCKLIGKGTDQHLKETEGLFELTREFSNDQGALADYLNECEVMYSYDPNSAMFELARLCGCKVCIIPSIYTREEFEKYEPGMDGIMWGVDDTATLHPAYFREVYMGLVKTFEERLDYFIEDTQS